MPKLLVTGASGFVGQQIPRLAADAGFDVHLAWHQASVESGPATSHQVDLFDHEQVHALIERLQPTHLLHLAWIATPGEFWTSALNDRWNSSSRNLLELFANHGGTRAVVAGSCAEYAWVDDETVCREHTSLMRPGTPYGQAKWALHEWLAGFAPARDVSWAWGHIFNAYGPHEHPRRLVADVATSLLRGERVKTTAGTQSRDFMHIHDVARAFVTLLGSDVTGPVNVASGENTTVRNVVEVLADSLGQRHLLDIGALPQRSSEPPVIRADVTRLFEETGFKPSFNLTDGLAHTADWWRCKLDSP